MGFQESMNAMNCEQNYLEVYEGIDFLLKFQNHS